MNSEDTAVISLIKAKRFIDDAVLSLMGRDSDAAVGEMRGAAITIEHALNILKGGEKDNV